MKKVDLEQILVGERSSPILRRFRVFPHILGLPTPVEVEASLILAEYDFG